MQPLTTKLTVSTVTTAAESVRCKLSSSCTNRRTSVLISSSSSRTKIRTSSSGVSSSSRFSSSLNHHHHYNENRSNRLSDSIIGRINQYSTISRSSTQHLVDKNSKMESSSSSRNCRTFSSTSSNPNEPNSNSKDDANVESHENSKANDNNNNSNNNNNNDGEKPSLEETLRRMKGETTSHEHMTHTDKSHTNDTVRSVVTVWDRLKEEVNLAWTELMRSGESKSINKKLITLNHPHATAEGEKPYDGPVALMMIDPSENLTAWERMQKRLTDAPIIMSILEKTEEIYHKSGASKVAEQATVIKEDAKEAWETSQNPWVYRISSVYDTMTAQSNETLALSDLRVLDPTFTYEEWKQDVVEHTLPIIMQWFLEGKINQLKPWLGESVFNRMASEMKAREKEGLQIDTNVLAIMNSEILAVEPDVINKGSPIIVLHFMCQQINCTRRKKDLSIVTGSEDSILAFSYIAAFQREYDEEKAELNWKIVDFRVNGSIGYL